MLKIRDDVDLKELEKFGFRKYEYTHLLVLRKEEHDFASIDIRNRRYEIFERICYFVKRKIVNLEVKQSVKILR